MNQINEKLNEFQTISPFILNYTSDKYNRYNITCLNDYSILFSDVGMKSAVEKVLNKKYKGDDPDKRPDLLFGRTLSRKLCLVEFKRPSFTLNRNTEKQAIEYRDDLNTYFHNQKIEIILLGGRVKENISSHNERDDVYFRT